jgi:hypothetical protein
MAAETADEWNITLCNVHLYFVAKEKVMTAFNREWRAIFWYLIIILDYNRFYFTTFILETRGAAVGLGTAAKDWRFHVRFLAGFMEIF